MTKIKLDMESDEAVDKVIIDVRYHNQKVVVKEYQVTPKEDGSTVSAQPTLKSKSHGFDANMMDIVNG